MRQIGTIPDPGDAKRLADYLLTLGITTRIDDRPSGQIVWVHREEKLEQARKEFAEFLKDPSNPRYQGVEQTAREIRRKKAREDRLHARNTVNLRGRWDYRPAERCPLTLALMGISVAVAVISYMGNNHDALRPLLIGTYHYVQPSEEGSPAPLLGHGAIVSDGLTAVRRGEVWRLVTPIFIHFGPWHLVFNMVWLYDLGGLIEMRKGTLRLALLVLLSAIASNWAQFAWMGYRNPLLGGMSGVVYALFGYVWMKSRYDPSGGMYLRQNTVVIMLGWLVLCTVGVFSMIANIANVAHFVGLAVGVILGFAPHWRQELRRW